MEGQSEDHGHQKEEGLSSVRPPGADRTGRTPDVPGVQIFLQDIGESTATCVCHALINLMDFCFLVTRLP